MAILQGNTSLIMIKSYFVGFQLAKKIFNEKKTHYLSLFN